jgi:ankyrin repeat protein
MVCECFQAPSQVLRQCAEILSSFRWTECQLDALCHCPTALSLKETLATLPPSLEKTYERLLCGIRPEHQTYGKRALYLLCFSYKPLSQPVFVNEVAEFAVIDPAHGTFDRDQQFYDPEEILEYCSGLIYAVPVSNDVRLAHSSVKEYLLSEPIRRSSAAPFGMTKREAQNSLAMGCLSYLMTFGGSKVRLSESYKDFPFLSYATHNWHRHIRREEDSNSHDLDAMILRFLDSKSNEAFSNWLGSFEPDLLLDEAYAPSEDVFSPLYMMAYFKCYEVIPLLVANTGSHHCHGRDCGPAFGIAIRGDIELLDNLIHCGCDLHCQLENGESVAAYAARCASSEVLRTLLDAGIETAATRGNPSMLMVAVLHQRREVVDLVLEDGSELFEMDTTFGSVLHAAVSYRLTGRRVVVPDLGIVEALLEWGASPDAHSGKHGSVLHTALASFPSEVPSSQLVEMLRTLLKAGADPNVGGGRFGCALQALMSLRITDNHKRIIFDLLLTAGAQIGFNSGPFGTLLQAAAASNTSRTIAQLILETTEDLNEVTGFFGTALQAASYANNIPVLMLLLDAGADVNTKGGSCGSALTAACHSDRSDDLQLVKALLDHGADVNTPATTTSTYPAGTPLQIAASKGNYDLVRLLLENGAEVNAPGTALGPALHACLLGTRFGVSTTKILAIALLLIASGADINQQSGSYGAPIILAAASGDPQIVKTLADAGADVNVAADGDSTTALHAAAAHPNSIKALRILLDTGAVVGPKDELGRTAIDVACSKGNIVAANALIAAQEAVSTSNAGVTTVSMSIPAPMGEEGFREAMDRWARVDPDHPRPDLYLGPQSSQPTGRGDQAIMMLDLPASSQDINDRKQT